MMLLPVQGGYAKECKWRNISVSFAKSFALPVHKVASEANRPRSPGEI